jgi:hypothetical protein
MVKLYTFRAFHSRTGEKKIAAIASRLPLTHATSGQRLIQTRRIVGEDTQFLPPNSTKERTMDPPKCRGPGMMTLYTSKAQLRTGEIPHSRIARPAQRAWPGIQPYSSPESQVPTLQFPLYTFLKWKVGSSLSFFYFWDQMAWFLLMISPYLGCL